MCFDVLDDNYPSLDANKRWLDLLDYRFLVLYYDVIDVDITTSVFTTFNYKLEL